jgi:hypothetical protein
MERVLMLEHHREDLEGSSLTFTQGNYYIVDDEALRQKLVDAKKAVPESEHEVFQAEQRKGELNERAEVLKVPAPPEVDPVAEGVLDVPDPPEIPRIEVPE